MGLGSLFRHGDELVRLFGDGLVAAGRSTEILKEIGPSLSRAFDDNAVGDWILRAKRGDFGDEAKELLQQRGIERALTEASAIIRKKDDFIVEFDRFVTSNKNATQAQMERRLTELMASYGIEPETAVARVLLEEIADGRTADEFSRALITRVDEAQAAATRPIPTAPRLADGLRGLSEGELKFWLDAVNVKSTGLGFRPQAIENLAKQNGLDPNDDLVRVIQDLFSGKIDAPIDVLRNPPIEAMSDGGAYFRRVYGVSDEALEAGARGAEEVVESGAQTVDDILPGASGALGGLKQVSDAQRDFWTKFVDGLQSGGAERVNLQSLAAEAGLEEADDFVRLANQLLTDGQRAGVDFDADALLRLRGAADVVAEVSQEQRDFWLRFVDGVESGNMQRTNVDALVAEFGLSETDSFVTTARQMADAIQGGGLEVNPQLLDALKADNAIDEFANMNADAARSRIARSVSEDIFESAADAARVLDEIPVGHKNFWFGFVDEFKAGSVSVERLEELAQQHGLELTDELVTLAKDFVNKAVDIDATELTRLRAALDATRSEDFIRSAFLEADARAASQVAEGAAEGVKALTATAEEMDFWTKFVGEYGTGKNVDLERLAELVKESGVDSSSEILRGVRRIVETDMDIPRGMLNNPASILDDGGAAFRTAFTPEGLFNNYTPNRWVRFFTGTPDPHDGRIIPDPFTTRPHRALDLIPAGWWDRLPGPLRKAFSKGNPREGLPNIFARDYFIKPAISHVDNALKSSGVMNNVIDLQKKLHAAVAEFRSGAADGTRLTTDQLKERVDTLFRTFADENAGYIDDALIAVRRLKEEVIAGNGLLPSKYPGMSGLNSRQMESLTEYVNDIEETLLGLRNPESSISLTNKYMAEIDKLASGERTTLHETLDTMLFSRLERVGSGVRLRVDGKDLNEATGAHHRIETLVRSIEGGSYNPYDRRLAADQYRPYIANAMEDGHNIENRMVKLLNELKKYTDPSKEFDEVEVANKFMSRMEEYYELGIDYDANRLIRVLQAKAGASSQEVFPEGIFTRLRSKIASEKDPHQKRWMEKVLEALQDIKDNDAPLGPRAIEARFYAPFAEFWHIARGYPPEGQFLSTPVLNKYLRTPLRNSIAKAWSYVTGADLGPVKVQSGEKTYGMRLHGTQRRWRWGSAQVTPEGEEIAKTNKIFGEGGFLDRTPWYLKMPGRLATGGMLSSTLRNGDIHSFFNVLRSDNWWRNSSMGLTPLGKIVLVPGTVGMGLFHGTEALGWNGLDDEPGWDTPLNYNPLRPAATLSGAGLTILDYGFAKPIVGAASLWPGGQGPLDGYMNETILSPARDFMFDNGVQIDLIPDSWFSWADRDNADDVAAIEEIRSRAVALGQQIVPLKAQVDAQADSLSRLVTRVGEMRDAARTAGNTAEADRLTTFLESLRPQVEELAEVQGQSDAAFEQAQESIAAIPSASDRMEAEEAFAVAEGRTADMGRYAARTAELQADVRSKIAADPALAAILADIPEPDLSEEARPDPADEPASATPAQRLEAARTAAATLSQSLGTAKTNVDTQVTSAGELLTKVEEKIAAERTAGNTAEADRLQTFLETLRPKLTRLEEIQTQNDQALGTIRSNITAIGSATDPAEAERLLGESRTLRDAMRTNGASAAGLQTEIRQAIEADAALASVLTEVPEPTTVEDRPPAGSTEDDDPVFIGDGGGDADPTGTPAEQLAALKSTADDLVRESTRSVESARVAAEDAASLVTTILEAQENARTDGTTVDPAWETTLAEVRRQAEIARNAYRSAEATHRDVTRIQEQVQAGTAGNLATVRRQVDDMREKATFGRRAQQQAAAANRDARTAVESDDTLAEYMHRLRQSGRLESVTGFLDGGNNGIFSNLTRDINGSPSIIGQGMNAISDAFHGVSDWWNHDVARAASRTQGGKTMYQVADAGIKGLLLPLMLIGTWNSTVGKWTGMQLSGGLKLAVVGVCLLMALRGSSGLGDKLDRMGGRYRATAQNYDDNNAAGGPYPFRSSSASVTRLDGRTEEVRIPNPEDTRYGARVFRDGSRRTDPVMQGSVETLPDEAGETYSRIIRQPNGDGTVLEDQIMIMGGDRGVAEEMAPSQ